MDPEKLPAGVLDEDEPARHMNYRIRIKVVARNIPISGLIRSTTHLPPTNRYRGGLLMTDPLKCLQLMI
jgi:hypothetical protein